jgi:DNA-binding PadR family transcriptional regulator
MFHVLLALAGDDLHGYAILKDVELRTDGEVKLSTGTLYGIIKRLLNDGLIAERRERPSAANDDERRRYYRLLAAPVEAHADGINFSAAKAPVTTLPHISISKRYT